MKLILSNHVLSLSHTHPHTQRDRQTDIYVERWTCKNKTAVL